MKVIRTLVVVFVLALQAAAASAQTEADASTLRVVEGGRWTEGAATGTYRIFVEEVGFEHVSCRVRIQWMASAAPGGAARQIAEQTFAEISTSFWSCGVGKQSVVVSGNLLKVRATHAYSGEPCTFTARLGAPGRYQYEACQGEAPAPKAGG